MIPWILIYILKTLQQRGCFNDEGTFQIHVKIYMDRNSRNAIVNYSHKMLPHLLTKHISTNDAMYETAHIRTYFGTIFNEINRVLKNINVQFRADFSDLYKNEYSELNPRYCGHFRGIIDIAEGFLENNQNPHTMNEAKLLIVDCHNSNAQYPRSSHIATKNRCGKVHAMLLSDPEIMKNSIAENIYQMFANSSISVVHGVSGQALVDLCSYVTECNKKASLTGSFVHDTGILKHKVLEDAGAGALGYRTLRNFFKNHDDHDSDFGDAVGHEHFNNLHGHRLLSSHHSNFGNSYQNKHDMHEHEMDDTATRAT